MMRVVHRRPLLFLRQNLNFSVMDMLYVRATDRP